MGSFCFNSGSSGLSGLDNISVFAALMVMATCLSDHPIVETVETSNTTCRILQVTSKQIFTISIHCLHLPFLKCTLVIRKIKGQSTKYR